MPDHSPRRRLGSWLIASAGALWPLAVVLWARIDQQSLHAWSVEDGPFETLSAILFAGASIGFVVVAFRSDFLRRKTHGLRYTSMVAWALLMFVFAGEEISWGQRVIGFETPAIVRDANQQEEFNLHNNAVVENLAGGSERALSLMILVLAVLPLAALWDRPRRVMQWLAFPIPPLHYSTALVGAYVLKRFLRGEFLFPWEAGEVREFVLALVIFLMVVEGARRPCTLFRTCGPTEPAPAKVTPPRATV
jgi:hypothetical protein